MRLTDLCKKIEEKFKEKVQTLVYIENDPAFKALLNKFLSQFNIRVIDIYPKEKIYEILEHEKFQLIIILSKEIREGFSKFIFHIKTLVPDLMILEYLYFSKIEFSDFFSWGIDDFIIKPFSLEEFKAKIFKLLKEYIIV